MTLKTVTVTGQIYNPDGTPAAGVEGYATLNRPETDNGIVIPTSTFIKADEAGQFSIQLWPNARGSGQSQYIVKAYTRRASVLNLVIMVPDVDVPVVITDIAITQPHPPIDQSLQALLNAQEAAVIARAAKDEAVAAEAAALASRNAAAGSATAANQSAQTADTKAQEAGVSAQSALESKNAAALSEQNAGEAKDDAVTAKDKAEAWAENPVDAEVEAGRYSAKHHSIKAEQSALSAAQSKADAETAKGVAEEKALAASGSATAAGQSASNAAESADDADAAKTEAQTAAGLAVDAQADIHTNWQGKLDIAAQQAETATTQAGIATDKAAEASGSAATANAAKTAAELARDAAMVGAVTYPDEATGRAAVADGEYFKVIGSGDVAAREYRRTNASTSVLVAEYPSAESVANAKNYADTKANAAEANARDYTDANIETISVDVPSVNLFNKDVALLDTHINATTGATYSIAGYFTSDWIPIQPNHTYSTRSVLTSALPKFYQYDANKNFISEITLISSSTTTSTTAPNAAYLRVNGAMATRLNDSAVYDTNYAKPYQAYEEKRFLDLTNQVNLSVDPSNLNFITQIQGSNLVDPNKGTPGIFIGVDGNEADAAGYWTTDFIPVKPNTVYSRELSSIFAEYDENKQFIKTTNASSITTDVNTRYIRGYFAESQRVSGQAFITEGVYTRRQPYSRNIVINGLRTDTTWLNKKMLWLGTSIPNGAGYPESVADEMGMLLNKKTLGGGNIKAFKDGGEWQSQNNLHFMLTLEKADVNSRYGHMLGKTVKSTDYLTEDASGVVLTQDMLDYLTRFNYEQLALPYIAETDLFVIDYGINDSGATTVAFEPARTAGMDRSKFAGAFGFLINKILQAKPSAVIIIVGHWVRYGVGSPTEYVVLGQEDVASYYGLPFMNIAAISGVNSINITALVPDNLHPPKDGVVAKRYSKYIVEKLRELTHGS